MPKSRTNEAIWRDYVNAQVAVEDRSESIVAIVNLLAECWAKHRDLSVSQKDRDSLELWVLSIQQFVADWFLDMQAFPLAVSVIRGVIEKSPWELDSWRVLLRALLQENPEGIPEALNSCPRDFTQRQDYDFGVLVLKVRDQIGPSAARIDPELIAEAEKSAQLWTQQQVKPAERMRPNTGMR